MSGLLLRSHMNAGQDGFRDVGSKQVFDKVGHWLLRSIPRLGSIDHTISSFPASSRVRATRRLLSSVHHGCLVSYAAVANFVVPSSRR